MSSYTTIIDEIKALEADKKNLLAQKRELKAKNKENFNTFIFGSNEDREEMLKRDRKIKKIDYLVKEINHKIKELKKYIP